MRFELEKIAERVSRDIRGDNPDLPFGSTDYDLWIEEGYDFGGGRKFDLGIIDMGDMYQGTYVWENGEWASDWSLGDTYVLIEEFLRIRRERSDGW